MSVQPALALIMSILPPSGDLPLLVTGDSRSVVLEDGSAWLRLLEQDYVFLGVSTDPGVRVTVYGEDESVLASSEEGGVSLSAFEDYWFWILLEGEPGTRTRLSVDELPPGSLVPGERASGSVSPSEMGEAFMFVPPSAGTWTFRLRGNSQTDLDLDVYGSRMSLWGGSYSTGGDETVSVAASPSESLIVVVTRYNKVGDGSFRLTAAADGPFPTISDSRSGSLDAGCQVARFMLEPSPSRRLLLLDSPSAEGDIDLALIDASGEYLTGSSSYSTAEALMLPARGGSLTAEVRAFDFGGSDAIRYRLRLVDGLSPASGVEMDRVVGLTDDSRFITGLVAGHDCCVSVEAEFDKLRDGDLLLFRGTGPAVAEMRTARGDDAIAAWLGRGDTLWVMPRYDGSAVETSCRLTSRELPGPYLDGPVEGFLSPSAPVHQCLLAVEPGSLVSVRLEGESRETDLDLFVSGPGLDRMAQGWLSASDAAGDEEISFLSRDGGEYAVTVYTYDRDGEGGFVLSADRIAQEPLAQPSGPGETWALLAGISGYPSAADVLDRASMDALDMYRFLVGEQSVDPGHVILLVDDMATLDAFRDGIAALRSRAGEGDRVVVFFSGHGSQMEPGSGGPEEADSADEVICLYDDDLDDDWLAVHLSAFEAPVILLVDACHSGGMVNDFDERSGVLILSAAREDLSVSERILTPMILEGSRGAADADGDGLVTAAELTGYVDERLQLVCPVCDAVLAPNSVECPECGASLKGENSVPRPEQGMFLDGGLVLWSAGGGKVGG